MGDDEVCDPLGDSGDSEDVALVDELAGDDVVVDGLEDSSPLPFPLPLPLPLPFPLPFADDVDATGADVVVADLVDFSPMGARPLAIVAVSGATITTPARAAAPHAALPARRR